MTENSWVVKLLVIMWLLGMGNGYVFGLLFPPTDKGRSNLKYLSREYSRMVVKILDWIYMWSEKWL